METIQKYVDKVKKDPELIRYIIIGVCTTLVNYVVYFCFTRVITLHSMLGERNRLDCCSAFCLCRQ